MPRPSRPRVNISELDWEGLLPVLLAFKEASNKTINFMDGEEYTGEDGITREEHDKNIMSANNKIYIDHKKAVADAKAKLVASLVVFKQKEVIPDLITLIGKVKPVLTAEGQVDIIATLTNLANMAKEGRLKFKDGKLVSPSACRAMVEFMKVEPRSYIGMAKPSAYTVEGHVYSACRPLVMSAWKLYHNIPYSQYNYSSPNMIHIVGPEMLELLRYLGTETEWSNEKLIDIRNQVVLSSQYGQAHNCVDAKNYSDDDEFNKLPRLVKLALLQLWVFHPSLYQSYAIMNLDNPDLPPEVLIQGEVFNGQV